MFGLSHKVVVNTINKMEAQRRNKFRLLLPIGHK